MRSVPYCREDGGVAPRFAGRPRCLLPLAQALTGRPRLIVCVCAPLKHSGPRSSRRGASWACAGARRRTRGPWPPWGRRRSRETAGQGKRVRFACADSQPGKRRSPRARCTRLEPDDGVDALVLDPFDEEVDGVLESHRVEHQRRDVLEGDAFLRRGFSRRGASSHAKSGALPAIPDAAGMFRGQAGDASCSRELAGWP